MRALSIAGRSGASSSPAAGFALGVGSHVAGGPGGSGVRLFSSSRFSSRAVALRVRVVDCGGPTWRLRSLSALSSSLGRRALVLRRGAGFLARDFGAKLSGPFRRSTQGAEICSPEGRRWHGAALAMAQARRVSALFEEMGPRRRAASSRRRRVLSRAGCAQRRGSSSVVAHSWSSSELVVFVRLRCRCRQLDRMGDLRQHVLFFGLPSGCCVSESRTERSSVGSFIVSLQPHILVAITLGREVSRAVCAGWGAPRARR